MKTSAWLILAVLCGGFIGYAHAQPLHPITWTPQPAVQPGTQVTISGQSFVLVRVPVRDLGGTKRYAVSFLAPFFGGSLAANLNTTHNPDPLPDPIKIDGFNATVSLSDGHQYSIAPDFTSLPPKQEFSVTAHVSCFVTIKVGETHIQVSAFLSAEQQAATELETPNAVPVADWDAYVHPTALVRGCGKWVNYIRIKAQN